MLFYFYSLDVWKIVLVSTRSLYIMLSHSSLAEDVGIQLALQFFLKRNNVGTNDPRMHQDYK